jgi:hypothetical protein
MRFAFPPYTSFSQAIGVGQERGGIAAVKGDGETQFVPYGMIHQAGYDGEIKAYIQEDGADRAILVRGGNFRVHFEGVILGRPARRDGPTGGARTAWAERAGPNHSSPGSIIRQGEGAKGEDALAQPGLERGGAEQATGDDDDDQGGIGGAENCREEGVPGEIIGVVFLAQLLDEVPAVGDQGAEEVEDLAGGDGVRARGPGPMGTGIWGVSYVGCDEGHPRD